MSTHARGDHFGEETADYDSDDLDEGQDEPSSTHFLQLKLYYDKGECRTQTRRYTDEACHCRVVIPPDFAIDTRAHIDSQAHGKDTDRQEYPSKS